MVSTTTDQWSCSDVRLPITFDSHAAIHATDGFQRGESTPRKDVRPTDTVTMRIQPHVSAIGEGYSSIWKMSKHVIRVHQWCVHATSFTMAVKPYYICSFGLTNPNHVTEELLQSEAVLEREVRQRQPHNMLGYSLLRPLQRGV